MFKNIIAVIGAYFAISPFAFASNPIDSLYFNKQDTSNYHFDILPETHLIPLFTGDSRAHRLSFCNVLGGGEFVGSMGGIFPVIRLNRKAQSLQFSAASTLYTTLDRKRYGGSLINTDFFVDLFFDLKLNEQFLIRAGAGHTSQHLSDDVVHKYLAINYVRDYYELFVIYQLPKQKGFLYGGIVYNDNLKTTNDSEAFDLSGRSIFQLGFEHVPFRIGKTAYIYWAGDIKFRGEVDYGTTQNIQVGIKLTNNPYKHVIRFAYNYSWGYDDRGQFYTQKRNYSFAGLYFDF